jgi:hypothetical protein
MNGRTRRAMKTATLHRLQASLLALTATVLAFARSTWADDAKPDAAKADGSVRATVNEVLTSKPRLAYGYWSAGEPRWFVSSKSDLGTPYVKPYVSFGYGMPHWIWAGVDVNAISTLEMVQGYTGVRAATPILDLAFGVRDTLSFNKTFLAPATSFSRDDVLDRPGAKARYLAWEGEAVGVAPLPYSALAFDLVVVRTLDVPVNMFVYDESYRAIVSRPMYGVVRLAAIARLLRDEALKAGVLTEFVLSTGRDKDTIRVGPAAVLQLTDHVQALAILTGVVSGPDNLGFALGAYGVAGLRYFWASGEPSPKVPWEGPLIP